MSTRYGSRKLQNLSLVDISEIKEQKYDWFIPTLKGNNWYLSEFSLKYLQELLFLGVTAIVTMQQWARWIYLDHTKIGGLGVCVHQFRVPNRPDYYVVVTQKLECPHQIYCIKRMLSVTCTMIHLSPGKSQNECVYGIPPKIMHFYWYEFWNRHSQPAGLIYYNILVVTVSHHCTNLSSCVM